MEPGRRAKRPRDMRRIAGIALIAGCSLCNLPGVGADIALLMPGIHG